MLVAKLRLRLRGFVEPDTSSQFEGYLEPGTYTVIERRPSTPGPDTDYALVDAPALGGNDTWICTRWRDQVYADVIERPPPQPAVPAFGAEDALPESALVSRLAPFHSFEYDIDNARYPEPLPGVTLPMAPPAQNNCCTFVEALLVKTWADEVDGFTWSPKRHRQMMIMSADDFFSPVTALVESGIAVAEPNIEAPPQPWTVIQGWRRQWGGGHTFIVVDHDPDTDRILTLESNSAYRLNGVGFRMIGNLRDSNGEPPAEWWTRDDLWTWQRLCSTYRHRAQAAVKVRDVSWSKRPNNN